MFENNFGDHRNVCCGLVSVDECVTYPIPLISVEVSASVIHAVAQVEVIQNYVNKEERPIEAIYYFPVNPEGAVTNFQAELDGRVIKGTVKPRDEAQKAYEKVLKESTTAFLGEEVKADIFKLRIGFLKPGVQVKILIEYITEVKNEPETNHIRFYIPTTIAPRYVSAKESDDRATDIKNMKFSVTSPAPLSISVTVSMQGGIESVESPTHNVIVEKMKRNSGEDIWHKTFVKLSGDTTYMDRDFVLIIVPGENNTPRLYSENSGSGSTTVMVHLVPSFKFDEQKTELIFVVDRSGSMMGDSISLAKKALLLFLHSMPADCYFNVLGFGSSYELLFPDSVKYDDGSLKIAKAHANGLVANLGGTEILEPLKKLYEIPGRDGYLKQMFILTDGEVSNTKEVFGIVSANAHNVRVFALGIGDAASHDLVEGVAKAGGGTSAFVTYNESIEKKALNQLKNSLQPSLTDIEIKWEGLTADSVQENETPPLNKTKTLLGYNKPMESGSAKPIQKIRQSPKRIPPVFDGSQLLVLAVFRNDCPTSALVTAQSPDGPLTVRVENSVSNNVGDTSILHRLAAIKLMRELETQVSALSFEDSKEAENLKQEIVEIACQNGLASLYTSFIAIDVKDDTLSSDMWVMETRHVPTQLAHGWHGGVVNFASSTCSMSSMQVRCNRYDGTSSSNSSLEHFNVAVPKKLHMKRALKSTSSDLKRSLKSNVKSVVNNIFKRGEKNIAKDSPSPLIQLINLQSYDGSFPLNDDLVSILGRKLEEMKEASTKHQFTDQVFATALAIYFFTNNLADEMGKWELIVSKARKWLTEAVKPENMDTVINAAAGVLKD